MYLYTKCILLLDNSVLNEQIRENMYELDVQLKHFYCLFVMLKNIILN